MTKNYNILLKSISPKKYLIFFLVGLVLRIVASFGYGDGDMEHFKSWAVLTNKEGLVSMYSKSDADLIKYSKEKKVSIIESFNSNRKYIHFIPKKKYWRVEYMIMYPPISEVVLYSSGFLHKLWSNDFENNRLFNFLINLPMLILSLLIFYLLNSLFKNHHLIGSRYSLLPFLYWLNPIFILDSPIQGYNNTIIFLLGLLAIIFYKKNKIELVVIIATLIFWSKPQGILLFPLFCFIIYFTSTSRILALKQIFFGSLSMSFIVLLIPILNGYGLSYLLGSISAVFSLDTWSVTVLSARSWNFWWLMSYFDSNLSTMEVSISKFNQIHFLNIGLFSYVIFILLISYFLFLFIKLKNKNLSSVMFLFLASLLCYNMFMLNVQYNQFIIFIPFVLYFSVVLPELFYYSLMICVFYFSQIFYYGGLGRDIGTPAGLVNRLNLNSFFNSIIIFCTILIFILWVIYLRKIYNNLKVN